MHHYQQLEVWKKAMDLSVMIYSLTCTFPESEKFGLVSQIRRCTVSIPSNIAEGAGRSSNKEFKHFLSISLSSVFELETQIILAERLSYLEMSNKQNLLAELDSIGKMIHSLRKKI